MDWKRSSVAAIIVLPVLALFWFGLSHDPRTIPSPLPGQPAPEFVLRRMDPVAGGEGGAERGGGRWDTGRNGKQKSPACLAQPGLPTRSGIRRRSWS